MKKYKIHIADDLCKDDNEKTCKFLDTFLSEKDELIWTPSYFEWKIKNNPAGDGMMTLAVSKEKQNVVGTVSITPKRLWYKGKMIKAAEIGDTYTHRNCQRQGIFTAITDSIRERAQKNGYYLVYGTPNEKSKPGYEKKLNFSSHKHFKLSFGFHIKSLSGFFSKFPIPQIMNRGLAKGLSIIMGFISNFWISIGKMRGIVVREVDDVDEEYDRLWEKFRQNKEFLLVRDLNYIRHRFIKHPVTTYQFYAARKNGRLCGYLVARIKKNNGRLYYTIADWFYDYKSPLVFLTLLNTALSRNLSGEVDGYHAWVTKSHPDKWLFVLSCFIFVGYRPIIFHKNVIGREILGGKRKWFFTLADSDNI